MSFKATAWAWRQQLPAVPKMVLMVLADCHNEESGQCNPSVRHIAGKAGLGQRTVETHIKNLGNLGLVQVEKRTRPDGSFTSNQYFLPLGSAVSALGGAGDAPPSAPAAEQEPGIEPIKEPKAPSDTSATATVSEGEISPKKKRVTFITETFITEMVAKYASILGGEEAVRLEIDRCTGRKKHVEYNDKRADVRGWLARQVKWQEGAENATSGVTGSNPQPDSGQAQAEWDARRARQLAKRGGAGAVPDVRRGPLVKQGGPGNTP